MKKKLSKYWVFIGVLACVGLYAAISYGGAKRITDYGGTILVSNYADTSNLGGTSYSDKYTIVVPTQDTKYDHVYFGLYAPEMTDPFTPPSDIGELDSCIIHLYTQKDYKKVIIGADSIASLPGSLYVEYHDAALKVGDTSKAGVYRTGSIGGALIYDHIWFDVYCSDSTGSDDSLGTVVTWWMRLVEDF